MMNAFHHQWRDQDYLFPPFSLLNKVLNKVQADGCQVVLIAPKWESQTWFPVLINMITRGQKPIELPQSG